MPLESKYNALPERPDRIGGDISDWFETQMRDDKEPQNAQEFTDMIAFSDAGDATGRLLELRDKSKGNIDGLSDSGKERSRQWAIIFLRRYQEDPNLTSLDQEALLNLGENEEERKEKIRQAIVFAREVIDKTYYLEGKYPSKGLEDFLPQRNPQAA